MKIYRTLSCRTSEERAQSGVQMMLLWLLGGVCVGTFLSMKWQSEASVLGAYFLKLFGGLAVTEETRTLWDVFCGAALPVLLLLGGLLYAGCSAVGQPIAAAMLLLRGMAVGLSGAACFAAYGLRHGLMLAGTMILPEAFLTGILLAYAARDALRLSAWSFGYLFHGNTEPEICTERKNIHLKWLGFAALTLAVAALHTALVWGFTARLLGGE